MLRATILFHHSRRAAPKYLFCHQIIRLFHRKYIIVVVSVYNKCFLLTQTNIFLLSNLLEQHLFSHYLLAGSLRHLFARLVYGTLNIKYFLYIVSFICDITLVFSIKVCVLHCALPRMTLPYEQLLFVHFSLSILRTKMMVVVCCSFWHLSSLTKWSLMPAACCFLAARTLRLRALWREKCCCMAFSVLFDCVAWHAVRCLWRVSWRNKLPLIFVWPKLFSLAYAMDKCKQTLFFPAFHIFSSLFSFCMIKVFCALWLLSSHHACLYTHSSHELNLFRE